MCSLQWRWRSKYNAVWGERNTRWRRKRRRACVCVCVRECVSVCVLQRWGGVKWRRWVMVVVQRRCQTRRSQWWRGELYTVLTCGRSVCVCVCVMQSGGGVGERKAEAAGGGGGGRETRRVKAWRSQWKRMGSEWRMVRSRVSVLILRSKDCVCVCVCMLVSMCVCSGALLWAHQPESMKFLFSTGRAGLLSNHSHPPITSIRSRLQRRVSPSWTSVDSDRGLQMTHILYTLPHTHKHTHTHTCQLGQLYTEQVCDAKCFSRIDFHGSLSPDRHSHLCVSPVFHRLLNSAENSKLI